MYVSIYIYNWSVYSALFVSSMQCGTSSEWAGGLMLGGRNQVSFFFHGRSQSRVGMHLGLGYRLPNSASVSSKFSHELM